MNISTSYQPKVVSYYQVRSLLIYMGMANVVDKASFNPDGGGHKTVYNRLMLSYMT